MALCVQYGCGTCVPEGWQNFDVTPAVWVQNFPMVGKKLVPVHFPKSVRHGDIRKGLPIADGSADAVYCSHVLEHLTVADLRLALQNTFRMLRPDGVFRLVVPDLRLAAQEYLASGKPDAGFQFVNWLGMGWLEHRPGWIAKLRRQFGNSHHLWMWDYESLAIELKNAGFEGIRRAVRGDSGDSNFDVAEVEERWKDALGIHCVRPA